MKKQYYYGAPRKSLRNIKEERHVPPTSVIVVGAGYAGLAAAHELLGFGYEVTVLEV